MTFSLKMSCYKFCITYLFQVGNKRRRTKSLSFPFQFLKMYASGVLLRDTILDVLLGDSSKTKLCHSPQTLSQPSTRQGYSSSSLLRRSSRLMAAFMATSPPVPCRQSARFSTGGAILRSASTCHTHGRPLEQRQRPQQIHTPSTPVRYAVPWGTRAQDAEGWGRAPLASTLIDGDLVIHRGGGRYSRNQHWHSRRENTRRDRRNGVRQGMTAPKACFE